MLTTAQAAAILQVHISRVHQLIRTGRLRAVKHGRDWAISEADLAAMPRYPSGWQKGRARGT